MTREEHALISAPIKGAPSSEFSPYDVPPNMTNSWLTRVSTTECESEARALEMSHSVSQYP